MEAGVVLRQSPRERLRQPVGRSILVVEDDRKTAELIRLYLEHDGYRVLWAADGHAALDMARQHQPDLIVLDLMLPVLGGLDLCRVLRHDCNVPIIMVTAKSTEDDVLIGLELGADDYVTKPFSPRQLAARVRAVLRRVQDDAAYNKDLLCFGELEVNLLRHEATLCGEVIRLTPREFKLLVTMAREPGRAFSRLELLERAFGYDYEGLERTVDAHIMNLRKKIEPDPDRAQYIETVYGVGYRFSFRQNG